MSGTATTRDEDHGSDPADVRGAGGSGEGGRRSSGEGEAQILPMVAPEKDEGEAQILPMSGEVVAPEKDEVGDVTGIVRIVMEEEIGM